MCVFTITWANSTFVRLYWGEKQNKEGVLIMTLARLGKWVGERAPGWSSLAPAAPGARRGQHTIAVGRTGTWPCATRNFFSLTCCSSDWVFSPIDSIICFVWRWRLVRSCAGRKARDLEQKIVLPAHATGCFAHYDSDIVLAVRGFDGVGDRMLHVGSAIC